MINPEKRAALEQYSNLVNATIEYSLAHATGEIVYDGWDPMKQYYKDQQEKANKYFTQRRLDRLKQQLNRLIAMLGNKFNEAFITFIKEKTRAELIIFENLEERIQEIRSKGKIETDKELNELCKAIYLLKNTNHSIEDETSLTSMMQEFAIKQPEKEYVETVREDLGDGKELVSYTFSTGPKPKHFQEHESISPNGTLKAVVTEWSDGKNASTYVNIVFKTCRGCVYGTSGIRPDIKVHWKNNNTVVIETKKEYLSMVQYKEVSSFSDVVTVEYIVA